MIYEVIIAFFSANYGWMKQNIAETLVSPFNAVFDIYTYTYMYKKRPKIIAQAIALNQTGNIEYMQDCIVPAAFR